MLPPKAPPPARPRVQVRSTPAGYAVQVSGRTVIRSVSHREALQMARDLRRALP